MSKIDACMWEIFVPTINRITGKPVKTKFHKKWDEKVNAVVGGLTIMPPTKGRWKSPTGEIFIDRMIPVRIAATKAQIELIMDVTLEHYNELAVMCYLVSNEVMVRYASKS